MKVLIIKTGRHELLESFKGPENHVSLGDVLRTTVLLHPFKNDQVTWITSKKAKPLLHHNPFIERLVLEEELHLANLSNESFDFIINLEKDLRFNPILEKHQGRLVSCKGQATLRSILPPTLRSYQEILYFLLDLRWSGEEYILHLPTPTQNRFDVGINWDVGPKWPAKAWPEAYWNQVTTSLNHLHLSRQHHLNNLEDYISWVQSCDSLITTDSLGIHLAIALKKKFIGLFGPTSPLEMESYNRGYFLTPKSHSKAMVDLLPEDVLGAFCRLGQTLQPLHTLHDCAHA